MSGSTAFFCNTGPSSPPTNFKVVTTGSESISVSWGPPPPEAQNGIITSYNLSCQPEEDVFDSLQATYSTVGNYSLLGFRPATTYNCSVFASTAGGSGPEALQTVTLLDDGNRNLITAGWNPSCSISGIKSKGGTIPLIPAQPST